MRRKKMGEVYRAVHGCELEIPVRILFRRRAFIDGLAHSEALYRGEPPIVYSSSHTHHVFERESHNKRYHTRDWQLNSSHYSIRHFPFQLATFLLLT